jgi:hypothetical protein
MGNFHTAPACGAGTESHPTKLGAETRRHPGTAGASKTLPAICVSAHEVIDAGFVPMPSPTTSSSSSY